MKDEQVEVGQVLFFEDPNPKQARLIPGRVVEEVTKNTLQGRSQTYGIQLPGYDGLYDLNKIGLKWYLNLEDAEKSLFDSAREGIRKILQEAEQQARDSFSDMTIASEKDQETNE